MMPQTTPFVGRDNDLNRLGAAMKLAREQQGSVWLVAGEEGFGKTRLLDELAQISGDMLVVRGQGVPDGAPHYHPWQPVLKKLLTAAEITDFEAGVLHEVLPDMSTLLQRDVADVPQLESRPQQDRLCYVITDLLRRVDQPVLLLLDDAHWFDESLAPVRHLFRFINSMNLMIVLAYDFTVRPDFFARLRAAQGTIETIKLNVLDDLYVMQLCEAFLGEQGRKPQVFIPVQTECNGHPLWVTEALSLLRDAHGTITDPIFSAGAQTIVNRRLKVLPEWGHLLLRVAAAAGLMLDLDLIRYITSELDTGLLNGFDLEDWLAACQGADFIMHRAPDQWMFRQSILRNTLLAEIDVAMNTRLHLLIARAIEALHADDLAPYSAQLAFHYGQTDQWQMERYYCQKATEEALSHCAYASALEYLSKAFWLTSEDDAETYFELLLLREQLYDRTGQQELQSQDLSVLESLVNELDDDRRRAAVQHRRAQFALSKGDYDTAIKSAIRCVNLAQSYDLYALAADGYYRLGRALSRQGKLDQARVGFTYALNLVTEARNVTLESAILRALGSLAMDDTDIEAAQEFYGRAMNLAYDVGDRVGGAMALNNLGELARLSRDYMGAQSYYEQSLTQFKEVGHQTGMGMLLGNLGRVTRERGWHIKALSYYLQGLNLAHSNEDAHNEAWCLLGMGVVSDTLGDYAQARLYLGQAGQLFENMDNAHAQCMVQNAMCLLLLHQGEPQTAQEYVYRALELARQAGDSGLQAASLANLGHVLIGLNHAQRAVGEFEHATNIHLALGVQYLAMESQAGLARALLSIEAFDEARQHIQPVLNFLESQTLEGVDDPFQVYLTCYRVLSMSGDPEARRILEVANVILAEQAARITDEVLRESFLNQAATHRALVQAWKDLNANVT